MFSKCTVLVCFLICCWPAESRVYYSRYAYGSHGANSISFERSRYYVDESDGSLEVALVASRRTSFAFYVRLDVILNPRSSVSLASREDVSTALVYVRFNRYQQKAVGTIKIFSDALVEGVEVFAVKMTLPSGGLYKRLLQYRHPKHTFVYIRDSTVPSPTMVELSASAYAVRESSGAVCVGVVANRTASKPFSVYVMPVMKHPASATSKDFSSSVCVAKFSVGQIRSSVCIPIYDDAVREGNEAFYVLLSIPNNAAMVIGKHLMARITIFDDLTDGRSAAKSKVFRRPPTKGSIAEKIQRCGCKKFPKPRTTTPVPVATTSISVVATASVTPVPVTTTPTSAAMTLTPVATTPAPVATTPTPVATTPAPVATTPTPVATTPAPVATTPAPVVTTPAPVATTPAPVATTPAPVATTPAPVATTPTPVAMTPTPLATTPIMASPSIVVIPPQDTTTPAPVISTPTPVDIMFTPVTTIPAMTPTSITIMPTSDVVAPSPDTTTPMSVVMAPTSVDATPTSIVMEPTPVTTTPTPITTTPTADATTIITTPTPDVMSPTMDIMVPTPVPTTPITPSPSPVICIEFRRVSTSVIESEGFVTINLIKNGSSSENIIAFITIMSQDPSAQSPAINVTSLRVSIPLLMDGVVPITIELVDDSIAEPFEFYELSLELDDDNNTNVKLGDSHNAFIVIQDDDDITVAFNSTEYSGAEADGIIPVTVVATGTASIPYTVIITPSESDPRSATAEEDFSNETIEITFNPGETEKTVNVVINPDSLREGSEFFNLSLSLPIGESNLDVFLGDPSEAVAEIENTDVIEVQFERVIYVGREESGGIEVILVASDPSPQPFDVIVVPMESISISAEGNGTDFVSDEIVATFNPGQTTVTVVVPVVADDLADEGTEFFALGLRLPNVSMDPAVIFKLGANPIAGASILDSDLSDQVNDIEISFSDLQFVAQESSGQLTAVITITGNATRTLDVNVIPSVKNPPSAQEDVDFKSEVIAVTIQPGQQTADVVFELLDDELAEGNETFCLFLFIPVTATEYGVKGGATVCAEALILDDVDDNLANDVSQNNPSKCTCTNDTEVTISPTSIVSPTTILPETTSEISTPSTMIITETSIIAPDTTTVVMPSSVVVPTAILTTAAVTPTNGITATATPTIPDPIVVQFDASSLQVSESDNAITVNIEKTGSIDEDFDVVIIPVPFTADTRDFDFSTQTIPFPRDADNITITISIEDDAILERDEMFIVTLNVVPNLPAVDIGPQDVLEVTITDNEAGRIQFEEEPLVGYEVDGSVIGSLRASVPASFPYTVVVIPTNSTPVSAIGGIDFDDTPINVTFVPGATTARFIVPIVSDSITEDQETFELILEVDVDGFVPADPFIAEATIRDETIVFLSFTENSFAASEAEGEINVTLLSSEPLNETYTVLVQTLQSTPISATGDGIDFVSDPVNAIFLPNQQTSTVTIPLVADNVTENTEYFGIRFQLPESPARLGDVVVSFLSGDVRLTVGTIRDGSSPPSDTAPLDLIAANLSFDLDNGDGNGPSDFVQIQFENSSYFANESEGELCGTITTIGQLGEPFDVTVIPLQAAPISAEGFGVDFDTITVRVTIVPGSSSTEVCVPITIDDVREDTETFSLSIVLDTFTPKDVVVLGTNAIVSVFIIDDVVVPDNAIDNCPLCIPPDTNSSLISVFFERSYYRANPSSTNELRVRVLLSRPASKQFDILLVPDKRDDVEEAGLAYDESPQTTTVQPGQTSAEFSIPLFNRLTQPIAVFNMRLVVPEAAQAEGVILTLQSVAVGVLVN